jgi:RND family efflux transporter MFP subunit
MRRFPFLLLLATTGLLYGCEPSPDTRAAVDRIPVVKTLPAQRASAPTLTLSGSIRAVKESPLAFQIGGRIDSRIIRAGQSVQAAQVLLTLDTRDLEQAVNQAQAEVSAAQSALDTAQDELSRSMQLFRSSFISQQALDRVKHQVQETQTRLDAARARAQQSQHALSYAALKAPEAGIITETLAEAGQVVSAGQPVVQFAQQGPLEIEAFLPQGFAAPETGVVIQGEQRWQATRSEVSGAADPASRTVRARYSLMGDTTGLQLGSLAQLLLSANDTGLNLLEVPLGALDERGAGAQVWIVQDNQQSNQPGNQQVQPIAVRVMALSTETAQIQTDLSPGTPVVAMGTHLLQPGMQVRVEAP